MPPLLRIRHIQQNIPDCPFSTPMYHFSPYFTSMSSLTGKQSDFFGNVETQEHYFYAQMEKEDKNRIENPKKKEESTETGMIDVGEADFHNSDFVH